MIRTSLEEHWYEEIYLLGNVDLCFSKNDIEQNLVQLMLCYLADQQCYRYVVEGRTNTGQLMPFMLVCRRELGSMLPTWI